MYLNWKLLRNEEERRNKSILYKSRNVGQGQRDSEGSEVGTFWVCQIIFWGEVKLCLI